MRLLPLLALLVGVSLTAGCHLGGKNSDLQASAKAQSKETWTKPKFARGRTENDKTEIETRILEEAHAAARTGRLDEARRLYGRVLDSDPRNAGAHHGLAILADREQDFGIAETHYLAALEARPRDPDLLNDVGYSYLQQERFSEAKRLFVRALEFDPGHQLATSNLGHVHAATGRLDEALELFRRVGTEEQAQVELAKYQSRANSSTESVADFDRPPSSGDEDDASNWSLEELQARRDEARLAGIAARRRRNEQVDFERLASLDREPSDAVSENAAPRVDARSEPNPFESLPPLGTRDESIRPVGFETPDPRNARPQPFAGDRTSPGTRFESPAPDRQFDPPGGESRPSDNSNFVEFGGTDPAEAGLWPPEGERRDDAFGQTNRGTNPHSGHRTLPPWPSSRGHMGDHRAPAPASANGSEGGLVIRPNAIQQRAAILGLNAGSGLPIPIEATSRTANREPFNTRSSRPADATVREPERSRPPYRGTGIPAERDEPAFVAPEPWSGAPAQSIPKTTAMVPSDRSLYRAANGRPIGYERAEAPYGREGDANGRIEDWANARQDFDREQAALEAERRAFQGGGAPRPDFPADFGPPTTQPHTRSADGSW